MVVGCLLLETSLPLSHPSVKQDSIYKQHRKDSYNHNSPTPVILLVALLNMYHSQLHAIYRRHPHIRMQTVPVHLTMYHTLNMHVCAQHPPYSRQDCKGGPWLWPYQGLQHLPDPVVEDKLGHLRLGCGQCMVWGARLDWVQWSSRQDGGVHYNDFKS